ncbi:MAG: CPBP family intramembrane metalloprotease [Planctomycetes bacterium]|nr:CPBP family intramembrane metalloprotease [Planctomycetota bacterium]
MTQNSTDEKFGAEDEAETISGDRVEPGEVIDNRLYLTFAAMLVLFDFLLVWLSVAFWFPYSGSVYSTLRVGVPAAFIILLNTKYLAPLDRFGLGKIDWAEDFKFLLRLGIPIAVAMASVMLIFVGALSYLDIGMKFFAPRDLSFGSLQSFLIGSVIWAPFMEELLYRGILFTSLKKFAGASKAIFISALAFVLLHVIFFVYGDIAFVGIEFVSHFAGGLILAYVMDKRNSLPLCMAFHGLGNVTIFALEYAGSAFGV